MGLESSIVTLRVLTKFIEVMTPAQCREVAHELRQFDGDDVEREFFDTVAQALDTYGDNTEREAQPS